MAQYRIGVDVGGTFTDIAAIDQDTGELRVFKVFTTPQDESEGTLDALSQVTGDLSQVAWLGHGFTVGLNAVLTRTGAKTGLLCTQGHRDILDFGRMHRPPGKDLYNPSWMRPHVARPLIARRYRRGVPGRILWDGSEMAPLDEAAVRREVKFMQSEGVEAIAICFINSYLDLRHEQRAKAIVNEVAPQMYVQTSEIYPVVREGERTVTVALDAYIGPRVRSYLERLQTRLAEAGCRQDVHIMQINGGYRSAAAAKDRPIYTIISGPVAGVLGAQYYSAKFNLPKLICCDIGGTSTDVGLIVDGEPWFETEFEIEHGLTLMIPSVGVRSVGAGGGSLITLDAVGSLQVGPESAGAVPGPACYGRGGDRPTLTDAYAVAGLLRPELFLGGALILDIAAARASLEPLAHSLRVSVEDLAQGAIRVAHAGIAEAVRAVTIYRGLDTREFALLAYGAAGPMAAADVAQDLAAAEVVVPVDPGAFCAFGAICADMKSDYSESLLRPLDAVGPQGLQASFRRLEERASADLVAQGMRRADITVERFYHGMYAGQTWDNRNPAPAGAYDGGTLDEIKRAFHESYFRTYGYKAEELPIMVTSTTVVATARGPAPRLRPLDGTGGRRLESALVARGDIHLNGKKHIRAPFYDRAKLPPGQPIHGPAVIHDGYSTAVVRETDEAQADEFGILRIKVGR